MKKPPLMMVMLIEPLSAQADDATRLAPAMATSAIKTRTETIEKPHGGFLLWVPPAVNFRQEM